MLMLKLELTLQDTEIISEKSFEFSKIREEGNCNDILLVRKIKNHKTEFLLNNVFLEKLYYDGH